MRCLSTPTSPTNDVARPSPSCLTTQPQDPRQYVPPSGQAWTSLHDAQKSQKNDITTDPHDPRIHYITTLNSGYDPLNPSFGKEKQLGIGERAILLQTPSGNILWDLIAYLDDATVDFIKEKGGLKAIAISHPHFYTTHLEWARIFDCPVYMCKKDEEWLNRVDKEGRRVFVDEKKVVLEGVTMIRVGGHFNGSAVLHWDKSLFHADSIMVVPVRFPPAPDSSFLSNSIIISCICVDVRLITLRSLHTTTKTANRERPVTPSCGRTRI
jgi:hypothetical protein